ncbi:MAG: ABC transporter substrate-binding protein [Candidatus Bathyarchaeota archaeon]|nr:ABC transporter substrate-binding protein [Candidatus Bathyarchaeota archaeon]
MGKKILALVLMAVMLGSMVVFQGYAYDYRPPIDLGTVTIGAIVPYAFQKEWDLILSQMALPDMNQLKAYGVTAKFDIQIKYYNNWEDHLQACKDFQIAEVDLIIGGFYSGAAKGALSYVNANNMLLFSPTSTYPILDLPNDNLYRMIPSDSFVGKSLAKVLTVKGVQNIIIMKNLNQDPYPNFEEYNKVHVVSELGYDQQTDEVYDQVLQAAEQDAFAFTRNGNKVAIVLLANEGSSFYNKIPNYPTLYASMWFGGDAYNEDVENNAGVVSAKIKLYNAFTEPSSVGKPKLDAFMEEFWSLGGIQHPMSSSLYDGYTYDTAMVIAKSVLAAKSVDASKVMAVLPNVSANYNGVTGYCKLDVNGDRANPYFDIIGYYLSDPNIGVSSEKKYGYLDYNANSFVWYPSH